MKKYEISEQEFNTINEVNSKLDKVLENQEKILNQKPIEAPVKIPPISDKYAHLGDYSNDPNEAFQKACIDPDSSTILELTEKLVLTEAVEQTPTIRAIVARKGVEAGNWSDSSFPKNLFYFNAGNPKFGIVGDFYQPKGYPVVTDYAITTKTLFRTSPVLDSAMLTHINSSSPSIDYLGWGLTNFVYGTSNISDGKFIDVNSFNVHYNGSNYTNLKSNANKALNANNIRWNMEGCSMFNPIIYNDNAPYHFYNPTDILVNGQVKDGRYTITSDNVFSQIKSVQHGYQNQNVRSIIHIGRFVFAINFDRLISDKEIDLALTKTDDAFYFERISDKLIVSDSEMHAGDVTSLGKIVAKYIYNKPIEGRYFLFSYEFEVPVTQLKGNGEMLSSSFNLSGGQTAYMIYKYNKEISWGVRENTQFGNNEIRLGSLTGYINYNTRHFGGNLKDVDFFPKRNGGHGYKQPYYRESYDDNDVPVGWQIENVNPPSGQWNPVPLLSEKVIFPEEVLEERRYLLSL